jgi:hypothetical protein
MTGHAARMAKNRKTHTKSLYGNLNERDSLAVLGVYEKVILKWI